MGWADSRLGVLWWEQMDGVEGVGLRSHVDGVMTEHLHLYSHSNGGCPCRRVHLYSNWIVFLVRERPHGSAWFRMEG